MAIPSVIPIRLMEDLHTSCVGSFDAGHQFFLSYHRIIDVTGSTSKSYLALYRFDNAGVPTGAEIRKLNGRDRDEEEVRSVLLQQLGQFCLHDIAVAVFQFDHDGLTFGLVPDYERGVVTLEPGSMIMFSEPWDGEYCT